MRTTGVIVTCRTNPIAQLAVEGRIRTLAPTCPCGAPATGDYPGIGPACDACLRRQRRAAKRVAADPRDHRGPGHGARKRTSPGGPLRCDLVDPTPGASPTTGSARRIAPGWTTGTGRRPRGDPGGGISRDRPPGPGPIGPTGMDPTNRAHRLESGVRHAERRGDSTGASPCGPSGAQPEPQQREETTMFHPIPPDRTVVDHQGRPSGPSGDAPGQYEPERRCTCCDGPDGLGYRHVRGLEGLRAILRTTCPGPFIVDDHRGHFMLGPVDWPEALAVLHDWDHEQALVAREERSNR